MDLLDLLMHPTKANQRYSPLTEPLTEGQAKELRWVFNRVREGEHRARVRGERNYASDDPVVCRAYARDASSLPSSVGKLIKGTPGAVVMPKDRGELRELTSFAQKGNVPLTPRGAGTGFFGGAVPAEGGVVVDMRAFDEVVEIDADAGRVVTQPGISWADLEARLNEEGLSLKATPFASPLSTIGGWVATGGGGFGSLKTGTVRDMLVEAKVVTPDGELVTYTGGDLDLVEGCCGTTGFIVQVTLDVQTHTGTVPRAASFGTIDEVQAYLKRTAGLPIRSLHVLGPEHVDLKQEALSSRTLPKGKFLVLTALADDDKVDQTTERLETLCEAVGGEVVSEDAAAWEWEHRFHHHCFKRFGPSLATGHAVVDKDRLAEAYTAGAKAIKAPEWAIWAVAISPDEVLLQAAILADERLPNHPLAVGNALAFEDAAQGFGGRPYAAGLLHAGQAKAILGKARVKRLSAWKKEHDKQEVMNPGKVIPARVKGLPIVRLDTALGPGMGTFKAMRGGFDHRRGSGPDTSNRALHASAGRRLSPRLADLADELYKCSGLGMTNLTGDLHRGITHEDEKPRRIVRAYRFDTQLPRGMVSAAKAILEGQIPGADTAGHALSTPCVPTYEAQSQNGVPILEVIEGVREAAQRAAGLDTRVAPLIDSLEAGGNLLAEDPEARGDWLPGGTPAGTDTTSLLVAGDIACYEQTDAAAAAFRVLNNAGFGFTTLGPKETHPGTIAYRLGAFEAAAAACQGFAETAQKHLDGHLPTSLVTLSNEDADVFSRRLGDLVAGSEVAGWDPTVKSFAQVVAELVDTGRLTFKGGQADTAEDEADDQDEDQEAAEEAEETEAAEDEQASDEEPAGEESDEEAAADDGPEILELTIVHSPFAGEDERAALEGVVDAMPGVTATVAGLDTLVPDIGLHLTHAADAKELTDRVKDALDTQALVACTDLAHILAQSRMDMITLPELVEQRMEVREGAGATMEVQVEEEEEGFKEHEIPEGAHRVELVKEEAAIPVYPDQSILDAAEEFGFDLPFDCRAGSCVTCSARWEGAEPDQSEVQAIDEDEQKTHCLTCVTKPKGDLKIWSNEQP